MTLPHHTTRKRSFAVRVSSMPPLRRRAFRMSWAESGEVKAEAGSWMTAAVRTFLKVSGDLVSVGAYIVWSFVRGLLQTSRACQASFVTVYEVRTSRVPHALFWHSSLHSMSTFHTRISQRYVMKTDDICGYEKDSYNNRTQQQIQQYTHYLC